MMKMSEIKARRDYYDRTRSEQLRKFKSTSAFYLQGKIDALDEVMNTTEEKSKAD